MLKRYPWIINLLLALGAGLAGGCLESACLLTVNLDGSATLFVRESFSPELVKQVGEEAVGRFREDAEKRAARLGKGVAMASFERINDPVGWPGYQAAYTVADVRRLSLEIGDLERFGGEGGGDVDLVYRFDFQPGPPAVLTVIPTSRAKGGGAGSTAARPPELSEPLRNLLANLRVTFGIQVRGDLLKTDSSYRSASRSNTVTVADLSVDPLLDNPEALRLLLAGKSPGRLGRLAAMNLPGVKLADVEKTVTLTFK